MRDGETHVQINHDELVAHQQRLSGLLDRVDAAVAASGEASVGSGAFGAIGQAVRLDDSCAALDGNGVAALRELQAATDDHVTRVGMWASDWAGREGDAVMLFDDLGVRDV